MKKSLAMIGILTGLVASSVYASEENQLNTLFSALEANNAMIKIELKKPVSQTEFIHIDKMLKNDLPGKCPIVKTQSNPPSGQPASALQSFTLQCGEK